MIKRSLYLLVSICLVTVVIAFLWSALSTKETFGLQAQLSKSISVAPSTASLLIDKDKTTDSALELEGLYSVEYESDYSQLQITGGPMTLKNLLSMQVHLVTDPVIAKNMDRDLLHAGTYETSEVQLLEDQRIRVPFFSVVIMGPIKISSDRHQGKLFLLSKAALSAAMGTPKVSFYDFNENLTSSIPVRANLMPFDILSQRLVIMPMNDFKIILMDKSGHTQSSPVFRGHLMRMEDFHFISARPWLNSELEGQAKEMINPVLGVPCKVTIKGESLSSIKFLGFNGWFMIEDGEPIQKKGSQNWEIKRAGSSEITVEMQPQVPSQVLVEVHFRGTAEDLIINNKSVQSFADRFVETFILIWSNPYLVGILGAVYAAILLYWIQKGRRTT